MVRGGFDLISYGSVLSEFCWILFSILFLLSEMIKLIFCFDNSFVILSVSFHLCSQDVLEKERVSIFIFPY